MLVPGQSMPAEGSTSTTNSPSSSSGAGLSYGAIAGVTVSSVVFVGILVLLFFVLDRNRVYSRWMSWQDGRNERTARWAMGIGTATDAGVDTRNGVGRGVNPWSRGSELDTDGVKSPPTDIASVRVNEGMGMGVGSQESGQGMTSSFMEGPSSSGYAVLPPYQASVHGHGYGQGHWSWDGVQGSRLHRGPVELEAHGVEYWSSETGGEREYR